MNRFSLPLILMSLPILGATSSPNPRVHALSKQVTAVVKHLAAEQQVAMGAARPWQQTALGNDRVDRWDYANVPQRDRGAPADSEGSGTRYLPDMVMATLV